MKILRVIGGVLLILAGTFCGMYAYAVAGGQHGWGEFSVHRLVHKGLVFAIGCPVILLTGVGAANLGSKLGFFLGALLAFGALAVAIPIAANHQIGEAVPRMIGAGVLAIASAVVATLGRKSA